MAEIPGLRKEDVDIRIDGNLATIGAEVKTENEENETHVCCAASGRKAMPAAASRWPALQTRPSRTPSTRVECSNRGCRKGATSSSERLAIR